MAEIGGITGETTATQVCVTAFYVFGSNIIKVLWHFHSVY